MKFDTLNSSIVILAEAHNPSILHPSFLSSAQIVPNDWQLAEPPICTPMVSVVKYANKVTFTVEQNKMMVLSEHNVDAQLLPEIAAKYVATLPYVHYTAVGSNLAGYIECTDDPEAWTIRRFLKPAPGNDNKLAPKTATIKLTYLLERGTLTLSCEPGSIRRNDSPTERPCLLINGNVHVPVSPNRRLEETISAIQLHIANIAKVMETVQVIFGDDAC